MSSERRKIVITYKRRGKIRRKREVDESDFRVIEELKNLFGPGNYHRFGSSGRLEYVSIKFGVGQTIPESLLTLDQLKELNIDFREVVTPPWTWLPREFGNLTNLTKLYIELGTA